MAQFDFDARDLSDDLVNVPTGFSVDTGWDSDILTLQSNPADLTPSYHGWGTAGEGVGRSTVQLVAVPATVVQQDITDVGRWGIVWDASGDFSGDFDVVIRTRFINTLRISFYDNQFINLGRLAGGRYVADYREGYTSGTALDDYDFTDDQTFTADGEVLFIRITVVSNEMEVKFWRENQRESQLVALADTVTAGTGKIGFSIGSNTAVSEIFSRIWLGTGADAAPFPDASVPATPSVTAGTPDSAGNVVLTSGAYSHSETHGMTQWQVDLQSGDYSDPAMDVTDRRNLLTYTVETLPVGDYKARIRHYDRYGAVSSWSANATFSVASRAEPATLTVQSELGNLIGVWDAGNSIRYGIQASTGMAFGGAQGGSITGVTWREELGRYGRVRRSFGGVSTLPDPDVVSGGQSGERVAFGPDAPAFLSTDFPGINKKFTIRDRISITDATAVGAAKVFWGMHLSELEGPVISGHAEAAIGFICLASNFGDFGNWFAVATNNDGTTFYRNIDSGVSATQFNDMRMEANGLTKRVSWYINNTLVTSLVWPDDMNDNEWDRLGEIIQVRLAGITNTSFDIVHRTGIAIRQYQEDL